MKSTLKSRALGLTAVGLLVVLGWCLWLGLPNRSSSPVQRVASAAAVAPSSVSAPPKGAEQAAVSIPASPSANLEPTQTSPEASQLAKIPEGTFREALLALEEPARTWALAKLARLQVPKEDFSCLHLSKSGDLFYACDFHGGHPKKPSVQSAAAAHASASSPTAAAPVAMAAALPIASPPIRHSRPGSPNVLYLDFNGMTITGTEWNTDTGVATYTAKPYDLDGNPTTFSDYEQEQIILIWARVAEDYAPFNVDVTTEEPAVFTSTTGRALITSDVDANGKNMPSSESAGVAFAEVFGESNYVSRYSPALIYYNGSDTTDIAETVAHELGHNLGLFHDGLQNGSAYYSGHGTGATSWGPIMGASFDKNITQWSQGDYYRANNLQDDMAIIAKLLGYVTDDAGNATEVAAELEWNTNTISQSGVIANENDVDVYKIELNPGLISAQATTYVDSNAPRGGNADVKLELLDVAGRVLSTVNPSASPDAYLSSYNVTVAGTYYLRIRADGTGSPLSSIPSGYTAYGSAGQYKLAGNINPRATRPPTITTQPVNQVIDPGSTATLSVTTKWATGYQWYVGTTGNTASPISSATSSTLYTPTLTSTTSYWVRVSNSRGSVDSATATITPLARPVITSQPASGTFNSGQSLTLNVTATGSPSYQWYAGTTGNTTSPINGATGASYTTPPLTNTNATSYWVRVTNVRGSADSATATLTYLPTDTATFRWAEYKALYADLTAVFGSNAAAFEEHWLKNGRFEGRMGRVPAFFDADAYLAAYGDLKVLFASLPDGQKQVAAYNHYINSGAAEGRNFREDFRYLEYRALYADLSAAFGSNILAYLQHWVNNGKPEGRLGRVPANFDVDAYLNAYGDLRAAFGNLPNGTKQVVAYKHFLDSGAAEGRNFSEGLRWAEYKELNADLKAAFGNNTSAYVSHWLIFGKSEGRQGRVPANFDVDSYLNAYGDLKAAFGGLPTTLKRVMAFNHYLDSGAAEGRNFSEDFRWAEYKELYSDLKAAFGNSTQSYILHWLNFGKAESRLGRVPTSFDVDAYLNAYADLKAAFGSLPTAQKRAVALNHYLDSGSSEGRNFSEDFRWADYKALNSDLQAAFGNTREAYLLHWLLYGKTEGRLGRRLPTLTTQPANVSSYTGASATLSVTATNATGYQWYVGTSGVTTNPISGATGASYTTPALSSTTSYWVRVSNPGGSIASATATVTLAAPVITNQPASVLIAGGTVTTLSVSSPNAVSYQWYLGTSGTTTSPIGGATAASYTTPTLNSNTSYWVKVTNPNGSSDSATATVTVSFAPPSIFSQPASVIITPGSTATTLTVTATAATSYQWYAGATGDITNPISGATGASYTTPALNNPTSYWVKVTNPFGYTNSMTALVQIPVVAMAAGSTHSLVLKSDGTVWATGDNLWGRLGTGDTTNRTTPVQVINEVSAISAGSYHSLLLKSNGTVWATGYNINGELGTGDTTNRTTPVQVMSEVRTMAAGGFYSLFIKSDGTVWAVGYNNYGQLGTGDITNRTTPVQVMSGVRTMAVGGNYSLFLKSDETVWAVGYNNSGQLGTGDTTNRTTPVQVMSGVRAVASGNSHSLFLKSDGTVWAAGENYAGQLGTGDNTYRTTPVQVISGVSAMAAGNSYSLFLKSDGTVWATGDNYYGQLGTGGRIFQRTPVQISF